MGRVLWSSPTPDKASIDIWKRQNKEQLRDKSKEGVIDGAIERYVNKLWLDAKSLYETMFYYLWWETTTKDGHVAMWFDRDHDLYQSISFALWSTNSIDASVWSPLLYARRKEDPDTTTLDKISFRQFWYHDGMYDSLS
jgi:hypothetical protein